jgi:membrane protein DedA with SNARE-associated domain/rhodanese-related sulfurtransferase
LNQLLQIILQHSYVWLFVAALLERIGLPLLVTPVVVAAGAVCALGDMNLGWIVAVVVVASELGDWGWYELGRDRGVSVLRILCRISLEPDSCVRKSEDAFGRHAEAALLYSKFLPGVGHLAAPVAGLSGMERPKFLLLNAAGSALWALGFALLGYIPARRVPVQILLVELAGWLLGGLLLAAGANVVWKYVQRQRFVKSLRVSRMRVEELKNTLDRGEKPFIVDLRHQLEFLVDPRTVPTATRIAPDELPKRQAEVPRDREVVLYCTCPSEATSAKVAMELRAIGIARVRPLEGGLKAWQDAGYPMDEFFPEKAESTVA